MQTRSRWHSCHERTFVSLPNEVGNASPSILSDCIVFYGSTPTDVCDCYFFMFCIFVFCSRSPLAHACGKIVFLNVDSIADRVTRQSLRITAPSFASAFSTRFTFSSRYAFLLPLSHFHPDIAIHFVVCQKCLVAHFSLGS